MSQNVEKRIIERRTLSTPLEARAAGDNGKRKLHGYAAVFNRDSEILWFFRESIKPGAFGRALPKSDIRALVDHDPSRILARQIPGRAGNTLSVREDNKGLFYEIDPADTTAGRDIVVSVERGDVTGSSFAFTVLTDNWRTVDGVLHREIEEVDEIFDVSPVTYPAYPDSSVGSRSLDSLTPQETTSLANYFGNLRNIDALAAAHRDVKPAHRGILEKQLDQLRRESQNRRIIY